MSVPVPESKGFFKGINDGEAGQFFSLAANFGGFVGFFVQIVQGIRSLLSQSDTDQILAAIGRLQLGIEIGFHQLGDLIKKQTQEIEATVNADAMATALSHTDAAITSLNKYLQTKDANDLRVASNEAVLGVAFFLELGRTPPDVFFLPGLIKAGTVRVAVAVTEDPKLFTSRPDVVQQINAQIALLASMIDLIKTKVDAAHVVIEKRHAVHSFPEPHVIIDGFAHVENVTDTLGNTTSHELQFFHAAGLPQDEEDPGAAQALRAAQNARNQGVQDELAFIGVPGFEAILQDWKTVVTDPNALPVFTGSRI